MNSKRYRPTQLVADEHLMSASDFTRAAQGGGQAAAELARGVRLTTLSPSLLEDLDRFDHKEGGVEPLEVLAACVRHARPLVMFLELAGRVMPLRLFPTQGLFACPSDFLNLPPAHVRQLRVLRLEPGVSYQPPEPTASAEGVESSGPLPLLSWQVAMHGERFDLLPEIQGRACYRVSPILSLSALPVDAACTRLLRRMRRHCLPLNDMAGAPGVGLERACRLLNALYLQAGLITLRTSPSSRHPSGR